jgi:hypothetical protein
VLAHLLTRLHWCENWCGKKNILGHQQHVHNCSPADQHCGAGDGRVCVGTHLLLVDTDDALGKAPHLSS